MMNLGDHLIVHSKQKQPQPLSAQDVRVTCAEVVRR